MIPELGHFALILALCMALVQALFPIVGVARGMPGWIAVARPVARAQLLCMLIAFACLTHAFIVNDFSVQYVARNSNTALPLMYRISAVWGAHEGSLLLWAVVLSVWTGAVTVFSRSVPENMVARVIGVMGFISVGFLLFMLFTSNPFERVFPVPAEGRDLNPLLQDPGLAIHPPMLYVGYVGFSVAFAFAIAAMLGGRLDAAWARWSRPWTNVAWVFLTAGIALGSWWAYYELGWGGWWFWDPVENASFMPWLVGTALMHSLAVTEKRSTFKAWTVLLAIFVFSLSLLGTFLVRSGVLTSVHAFATDPERGVFILIFLGVVVGSSLALYAWRAPHIRSTVHFELVSRETGLLLNNVLLIVVAASILLGTLYPLVIDALGIGKISVGPPYFNSVFIPLTIPMAVFVGIAALARWKQDSLKALLWRLRYALVASVVIGVAFPLVFMSHVLWQAILGMVLAAWVCLSTLQGIRERVVNRPQPWRALLSLPRGFYGMSVAHLGIAVFIVGITLTSLYSEEKDVRLAPGESHELGGYRFRFEGVKRVSGPNYQADEGHLIVTRNDAPVASLAPQKRFYHTSPNPMTEAAIDAGLSRDLFVALGEPLGKEGAWSVRLYHKPYIRWIWLGAIFMSLGGLLAASDRRYRVAARRSRERAAATDGAAAPEAAS
jgi:cytochrome c-type biogenesis protein CcmF